ncbi:MAG TPA: hypothetical protein VGD71_14180 [Kribbella sp.]|jgi:hypothetical protein
MGDELDDLRKQFTRDMLRGVETLSGLGYSPKLFRRMLAEHGAVEAARRLVLARTPSYGLWKLKEMNKLDTSVEMWVLLPWYEPLFDAAVRAEAERKLTSLGCVVQLELGRLVRILESTR